MNPFKKKQQQEKKYYLIIQFQVIYKDGSRDIVKLNAPIEVDNVNDFRMKKKAEYQCEGVNLTYYEV